MDTMDNTPTLTHGSLFTGVGGFDLAFDQAGYQPRFQVEWDKHCQQVLAHHWPEVPRWHDVCDVNGADLPPVDVLTFGSPCQDLSVAGKRTGLDGNRSSMFYEAVRIIKEMRDATAGVFPRITIWENVPGALSSNKGDDFQAVLEALGNIGALGQWWNVLDAQFFGVPQRRRRVFLISVFDPAIIERVGDGEILAVGKGRRRNPKKGESSRENTPRTLAESIGFGRQRSDKYDETDIASTIAARDHKAATDLIVEPTQPIAFSHTQGLDPQPSHTHTDIESEREWNGSHGS